MALKAKIDKAGFDALAEVLQSEYTVNSTNADVYELAVEGAEDVNGLKSALEKERRDRKAAEATAKQFEGLDVKAAKEALAHQQESEQERLKAAGKWDELKGQLIDQHVKEKDALTAQLGKKDQAVAKLLIENVARKALIDAKVKGTGKAVMPEIIRNTKIEYDEPTGEYKVVVIDSKGNPRISNGKGDPMTITEYVEELKADAEFGVNFEPSGSTGGGSQGQQRTSSAGGGKTVSRSDQAAMSANMEDIAAGKVTVVP